MKFRDAGTEFVVPMADGFLKDNRLTSIAAVAGGFDELGDVTETVVRGSIKGNCHDGWPSVRNSAAPVVIH
jgi:hypothetical protein